MIQGAYIQGASTRSVDELVKALGMSIGASEAKAFWVDFLRTLARRGLPSAVC